MYKRQISKLNMYRAVHNVLEANQNVWDTIPAFVSAKDEFYDKLSILIQLGSETKSSK